MCAQVAKGLRRLWLLATSCGFCFSFFSSPPLRFSLLLLLRYFKLLVWRNASLWQAVRQRDRLPHSQCCTHFKARRSPLRLHFATCFSIASPNPHCFPFSLPPSMPLSSSSSVRLPLAASVLDSCRCASHDLSVSAQDFRLLLSPLRSIRERVAYNTKWRKMLRMCFCFSFFFFLCQFFGICRLWLLEMRCEFRQWTAKVSKGGGN